MWIEQYANSDRKQALIIIKKMLEQDILQSVAHPGNKNFGLD